MAEQLQSFKKILTKKYIKTGTTPVFTGELEKLRGHWDAFVESVEGQRQCLEESVPSHSRPKRLQACNTQMGKDGAGSD